MNKKVTMSDIAKMCNVSVASVSYVLNQKENSRISEETKQKILQMANLYMYRSNPYARSLATGEMHNILFFYEEIDFYLYKADILNFMNQLSTYLRPFKYNIIVAPNNQITKYNYVDAIITYRIDKTTFKKLGEINFIPLISLDCVINDNLFFEINNSFNNVLNENNFIYLSFPYKDEKITNFLKNKANIYFIDNLNTLNDVLNNNLDKTIFCLNHELSSYLDSINVKHTYLELNNSSKFKAISDALNYSINREETSTHQFIID